MFFGCGNAAPCHSVKYMTESSNDPEDQRDATERPIFNHPPWMVGIILILAVLAILAGISDPIWFFLGLPCILVLVLYIYVRIATWRKRER